MIEELIFILKQSVISCGNNVSNNIELRNVDFSL